MPSNNIVKISAAGSGKTWDICHDALTRVSETKRKVLITTYTNRGADSIRTEICKQNFGILNPLVIVKTWYEFLMSEVIKPYQTAFVESNQLKGIDFSESHGARNFNRTGTKNRYINSAGNVRSNWASEFAYCLNIKTGGKVINRLEKIYSHIYFDEIQDLAGYDIELLKLLFESDVVVVCCGDNKQATFSTNSATKNKAKTGSNIWVFFEALQKSGYVEVQHNLRSRRFNADICAFANAIFPVGEPISTIMTETTEHDGVFLIQSSDVTSYYKYFSPKVLIYDSRTRVNEYQTVNFGACKGETFDRILIYPNGPMQDFVLQGKALTAAEKYYVAVTRPRYSIAIVVDTLPDNLAGYEYVDISLTEKTVKALRYIVK